MQTLAQTLKQQAVSPALSQLLLTLAQSSVAISQAVRHGALAGVLGATTQENVQGETQKKLDVITNEMLKDALKAESTVRALASEEEDHIVEVGDSGEFLVCFDPLDGSSNIDINSLVGTIFSVLPAPEGEISEQSFLQKAASNWRLLCALWPIDHAGPDHRPRGTTLYPEPGQRRVSVDQ